MGIFLPKESERMNRRQFFPHLSECSSLTYSPDTNLSDSQRLTLQVRLTAVSSGLSA